MSKTTVWENSWLDYELRGTAMPNLPASGAAFYVALFRADPGESGTIANEANYAAYARQPILRQSTGNGFAISTGSPREASNLLQLTFPAPTSGANTITYFGIVTALSGGVLLRKGQLLVSYATIIGTQPTFPPGSLVLRET